MNNDRDIKLDIVIGHHKFMVRGKKGEREEEYYYNNNKKRSKNNNFVWET
jgi:hypothetical protein